MDKYFRHVSVYGLAVAFVTCNATGDNGKLHFSGLFQIKQQSDQNSAIGGANSVKGKGHAMWKNARLLLVTLPRWTCEYTKLQFWEPPERKRTSPWSLASKSTSRMCYRFCCRHGAIMCTNIWTRFCLMVQFCSRLMQSLEGQSFQVLWGILFEITAPADVCTVCKSFRIRASDERWNMKEMFCQSSSYLIQL